MMRRRSSHSDQTNQDAISPAAQGRLEARPALVDANDEADAGARGLNRLGLGGRRDGLRYVPAGYAPSRPARLVLMLHGAGGSAEGGISAFQSLADEFNLILLAVESRRETWDVIFGAYGPDVAFIDSALAHTFAQYRIDPTHVAVEGFSDGASYALSLGLNNGDLFTHIAAFSPGFMVPTAPQGKPRIYISHGDEDGVLPIDRCSRRLVPQLKRADYDTQYHEFHGPHTVPNEIAVEALRWFTGEANA